MAMLKVMFKQKLSFLLLLTVVLPLTGFAQISSFKGYVKELGSMNLSNDLKTVQYDNILHNRIESRFTFDNGLEFRADLRNRLLNGYSVQNITGYSYFLDQDPGFVDMSWILIDSENTILNSSIDRLQVSYFKGPWEATLGRQRINWGKTSVWNPNDLFNAYAYLDFDYEERPGTDALSAQYSWSYASSIQTGYKFGDSFNESVLAFMFRSNLGDYDIQVIAGNYFEKLVLGAGWSGYLNNAGFKGEISYFHPRTNFFNEQGNISLTMGSDYMFSNSIYLSGELLYNGGFNTTGNPLAQLTTPPTADNLFTAKTGYFANTSYPISPLTNISVGILGSFTESIFILIPQISYSVTDNIDFLLLAQLLKGNTLSQATKTPNILFFRVKYSF